MDKNKINLLKFQKLLSRFVVLALIFELFSFIEVKFDIRKEEVFASKEESLLDVSYEKENEKKMMPKMKNL